MDDPEFGAVMCGGSERVQAVTWRVKWRNWHVDDPELGSDEERTVREGAGSDNSSNTDEGSRRDEGKDEEEGSRPRRESLMEGWWREPRDDVVGLEKGH